jgi:two-component system, NarL family, response regulator DevR
MLKIVIVDDHQVVRLGLRYLLESHSRFQVVGEAGSTRDAVEQVLLLQPDVVLMDVRLPDGSGVEACRTIVESNKAIRVIILTSFTDEEDIFSAIVAGASGYLLKQIDGDELIRAIEKVGSGESLLDPGITGKVMQRMKDLARGDDPQKELTPQEKRILCLISEGKTNRDIGEILALSEKTIKNYVSAIFNKLDINNRAEAAVYAVKHLLR